MVGINVDDDDTILSDVTADKVEANWDMTGPGIDARVRGKSLRTAVVDENRSGLRLRKINFLQ